MMDWRRIFDFRRTPYLRPNETWACGRAAQGGPCRLGPGAMGRCRTRTECDPIVSQGNWVCTRSSEAGGKCEEGPTDDGICCRAIPKCVPVRNLRSLRGRVSFWVFAATLVGLVASLGTDLRFKIVDPGPVIQGHAEVVGCNSCHTVGEAHAGSWLQAAWAPADPAASSAKCLTCHDRGRNALRPHSMAPARLAMHSRMIASSSGGLGDLSTHLVNGTVFPAPESAGEAIACATCHKDHKGLNFDPNVVSNGRCQTCHKQKFASLEDGHPSFGSYPYVRRSRLAFDHNKHFQRHFGQAKGRPPTKCASCHQPDPTGRYMVVRPFETTCGSCHTKDIEGTGLAGAKGIPVFSVPGLDTQTLKAKGFGVGHWPEDADSDGISPFIKALLAADATLDQDLRKLADIDLQDLSGSGRSVLAAAARVAWGFKELLYELGRHGGEAVHVRMANGFGLALDREAVGRLVGNIPHDVIRAAQARWFPRLEREIVRHRKRRAGLIADEPASHAGLPGGEAPLRDRPVRLALAGHADGHTLLELGLSQFRFGSFGSRTGAPVGQQPRQQRLQLAQAGDLLDGNTKLIDGSSLRLKEYKELKREDRGADNSVFKKGGASKSSAKSRAKPRKKEEKKTVVKKPEKRPEPEKPAKKKTITKKAAEKPAPKKDAGSDSAPESPPPEQQAVRDEAPEPADRAAENTDAGSDPVEARPEILPPELQMATPPLQRPDRMTKLGPVPDPEQWARSGGWYRADFTLFYRPAAHKDPFMRSWLDFAAEAHAGPSRLYGEALLASFRNADTVGKCVRCHSVDRIAGGKLAVNWTPFTPDPNAQKFTVFNHATHFSMAGERGCQSCHRLNPKAKFAVAYRGLDATSFESNFFAPIKRETCAECHVPESSGNDCTQCHRYHVGEFVSAPIVTEITARRGAMTRFGTVPSGPAVTETATPEKAAPETPKRTEPKVHAEQGGTDIRHAPIPKRKPVRRGGRTARSASVPAGYGVRLGSYLTKKRARDSSRRLRRTVAAFLSRQTLRVEVARLIDGRRIYRVVARPFTKRQAQRACRRIAAKRKIRCSVTR